MAGAFAIPRIPENPDCHEPDQHDRPKYSADESGAPVLDGEQHEQDRHGKRHDRVLQMRSVDLDAFDGAEDGNRRRDGAVAIEQGCPHKSDHHHDRTPPALLGAPRTDQREQREDAALPAIVGAHDQDGVFDGNDNDQRPEDQRHNTEHRLGCDGPRALAGSFCGYVERIERTCPDVAEYDPHTCQRGGRPGARCRSWMCSVDFRRGPHASRRESDLEC